VYDALHRRGGRRRRHTRQRGGDGAGDRGARVGDPRFPPNIATAAVTRSNAAMPEVDEPTIPSRRRRSALRLAILMSVVGVASPMAVADMAHASDGSAVGVRDEGDDDGVDDLEVTPEDEGGDAEAGSDPNPAGSAPAPTPAPESAPAPAPAPAPAAEPDRPAPDPVPDASPAKETVDAPPVLGTPPSAPSVETPDPVNPDPGAETPDPGTDTPDPGTDTPDPGTDTPDPDPDPAPSDGADDDAPATETAPTAKPAGDTPAPAPAAASETPAPVPVPEAPAATTAGPVPLALGPVQAAPPSRVTVATSGAAVEAGQVRPGAQDLLDDEEAGDEDAGADSDEKPQGGKRPAGAKRPARGRAPQPGAQSVSVRVAPSAVAAGPSLGAFTVQSTCEDCFHYRTVRGDSLWVIADELLGEHATHRLLVELVRELRRLNNIVPTHARDGQLEVGVVLVLPKLFEGIELEWPS
jgi:hypothetical protein